MTVPAPVQDSGPGGETGRDYDVVVLGGGPVGINAANRAHAEGLSVAIIERELVGGECNYWGCSSRIAHRYMSPSPHVK
jgi:pyruvate/2-oxoglutarate dehydrogenase complex dihydrolipoamide dehydrogenase (E3) component